ncbi:MAG: MFS transporter [Clostridia bacterium]|nr:MFS transporter [Clostridia bacterium]
MNMDGILLNFNRIMANFSTKLVGGFIPLIVYKYATSYKLELAILTIVIEYLLAFLFGTIMKKWLIKKPQLFLFLRVVPIICYEILLLYVAKNPLLCVIGIGVAYSFSYAFKYIPTEVLFTYINARRKVGTGRQLAITKTLDQLAIILGVIIGGLALDHLDMRIVIIVSISLYTIGALPQLIYYLCNFKKANVNQEYASYAHIALKEHSQDKEFANKVSKKVRVVYCLFYFLQESWQAIYILIPLLTYTLTGMFTYSAIATAIFDGVYGVCCLIASRLNNKKDLTIASSLMGIVVGIMGISLVFINKNIMWMIYIICGIMAVCYAFAYFFMYDRMLKKSKIIGRNNTCVINKINMFFLSTCFVSLFGLISLPVAFCVGGGMSILGGAFIPYIEEKTRRMLVDHLEDNEIKEKGKMFFFKKRKM